MGSRSSGTRSARPSSNAGSMASSGSSVSGSAQARQVRNTNPNKGRGLAGATPELRQKVETGQIAMSKLSQDYKYAVVSTDSKTGRSISVNDVIMNNTTPYDRPDVNFERVKKALLKENKSMAKLIDFVENHAERIYKRRHG